LRLVFDTNIYIATATRQGFCERLLRRVLMPESNYSLWISDQIYQELEKKLHQLKKKKALNEEQIVKVLHSVKQTSFLAVPTNTINAIKRDPNDNKILECAVAASADLIITMDKDLLQLKTFRGIAIVHPKTFSYMQPKS